MLHMHNYSRSVLVIARQTWLATACLTFFRWKTETVATLLGKGEDAYRDKRFVYPCIVMIRLHPNIGKEECWSLAKLCKCRRALLCCVDPRKQIEEPRHALAYANVIYVTMINKRIVRGRRQKSCLAICVALLPYMAEYQQPYTDDEVRKYNRKTTEIGRVIFGV